MYWIKCLFHQRSMLSLKGPLLKNQIKITGLELKVGNPDQKLGKFVRVLMRLSKEWYIPVYKSLFAHAFLLHYGSFPHFAPPPPRKNPKSSEIFLRYMYIWTHDDFDHTLNLKDKYYLVVHKGASSHVSFPFPYEMFGVHSFSKYYPFVYV